MIGTMNKITTEIRALLTSEEALSGFVRAAQLGGDLLDGTKRGLSGSADAILPDLVRLVEEREREIPNPDLAHRVDWFDDEVAGVRSCKKNTFLTVSIYDDKPTVCADCGAGLMLHQHRFVYVHAVLAERKEEEK